MPSPTGVSGPLLRDIALIYYSPPFTFMFYPLQNFVILIEFKIKQGQGSFLYTLFKNDRLTLTDQYMLSS